MGEGDQFYHVTDLSLADTASTLSRTSPPLLTLDLSGAPQDHDLRGIVALTDAGRSVLAGRLDRVACGIDRWLGGVHLQSGSTMWRWDDTRQQVIRA
jgi:hypothetical protein